MEIGSKIEAIISHIDPYLELNKAKSCHLSIQVNLDGFSFAILNLQEQKYIALEHYDIQNLNSKTPLLQPDNLIQFYLNQTHYHNLKEYFSQKDLHSHLDCI